ncbi:MAG TPA: NfeD family protein [Gemmataceae bacterium]|nr:NfeD family protein [Gemmataceae bacterium]
MLRASRQFPGAHPAVVGSVLLLLLASLAQAARGDDAPSEGIFVTVTNPITSEIVNKVRGTTERFVSRFKGAAGDGARRELKIIYDFNPDNKPAGSPYFGPCRDLADFLLDQKEVRTVAFVHARTTRHTVLPILACRDVVMSSDALLGDVRGDQDPQKPLASDMMEAYRRVAADHRCPAIALKMLDPDMEVVRATRVKGSGDWYIDRRRADEEAKNGVLVVNPEPVLRAGASSTLYSREQAEHFGVATLVRDTRDEVRRAYRLAPASLREDPLMGRNPVAWRIDVRGAVTTGSAESLRRQVGRAVGDRAHPANLIFLQLECGGGDTLVARDLAAWLRDRKDDRGENPIMTVAFVPRAAPDTAVFLALGCTEIVMQKGATFGDFSDVVTEKRNGAVMYIDPNQYRAKRDSLEELANQQGYPALLARGMMDRELEIYRVRHKDTGEWAFVSKQELAKEPKWGNAQLIKPGGPDGKALLLTADQAREFDVARHTVEGLDDLYALYGVSKSQVQVGTYDWLDEFAEFLRRPLTRIFLVMIGIVCLMLELKMPGVGVPGVIAAVCFVLFFWSHSQSAGLDLLGVLLFILGLALIGLEVFVLPGFGVAGVSGALLVVFSLALVALEKRPQTSEDWVGLLIMMAQFGMALIGAVLLGVLLVSYLPHIPYLNRLILRPRADADVTREELSDAVRPETAALLGAIGVAATPLRPAGKVKFGDEYIDVVAEGAYVDPGTRVQVVEIEGNRIVVKEVL